MLKKKEQEPSIFVKTCIVIGEQSLLTQCCELLTNHNYQIQKVVTTNPLIVGWCEKNAIKHCADQQSLLKEFARASVDFVFSITNLSVLPDNILAIPRRLAINFHDGPLPEYGGLNAPAWALLAGESEHGVSWHVMTSAIDSGELLVQQRFPISEDESAFTLNAKCYAAAIESFEMLLEMLQQSPVPSEKHDLSRETYHGLSDRPDAAATIDWNQSVLEIDRLVRSLDFGRFSNPLAKPRIHLGLTQILVGECTADRSASAKSAGTILDISDDAITVATIDGSVKLSQLTTLDGKGFNLGRLFKQFSLRVGSQLPLLSKLQRQSINTALSEICRHEKFWLNQLSGLEPMEVPFSSSPRDGKRHWEYTDLDLSHHDLNSEHITAVFALLLARLNTKTKITLAVRTMALQQLDSSLEHYVSPLVPLNVRCDADSLFSTWFEQFSEYLSAIERRVGYLTDLRAREPVLTDQEDCSQFPIRLVRVSSLAQPQAPATNDQTQLVALVPDQADSLRLYFDNQSVSENTACRILEQYSVLLDSILADPKKSLATYPVVPEAEFALLQGWQSSDVPYEQNQGIHHLIERSAIESADTVACYVGTQQTTYGQLNARANQLARYLLNSGVQPGERVGVLFDRSMELMVALLATLKAGCAYVPMDPSYPESRLSHMITDSGVSVILTQQSHAGRNLCSGIKLVLPSEIDSALTALDATNLNLPFDGSSLAYVIYTSGSTGKPKGVMVEHRNVINFFMGMDQHLEPGPGTWLAVTSVSFDISVLELFWTLCRGFTVVMYAEPSRQSSPEIETATKSQISLDFGLFYWNVADDANLHAQNKYNLLLESAKFADKNGFCSVWTPERHFASFGGLFPNPSVTSAALATITEQIAIRAGSCVVPLHSPIRIAEEWAVVDNLSNGRVGIAIAAGWAAPDFAIKPENFSEAKKKMFESAATVQKLWRGETIEFPGPDGKPTPVRTLPRPLQPELPLWVTTAGNIDNFISAGKMGANLLTHLLGQTIEEVAEKVVAYRSAWKEAGHPDQGTVTVMLHTFVGNDADKVEQLVREPLKNYLKSAMFLVKDSAWQFPTFKKMSEEQGKTLDEFFETISDDDMDALLEFAFDRYFHTSGLFGTPESCLAMIDKLKIADVDEVACLIDFGIKDEVVLEHLPYLNKLKEISNPANTHLVDTATQSSLPELMQKHQVTHLQCTPSMATLLAADPETQSGLARLKHMMVGGEAFPPELASRLANLVGGRVTNMYGPTETTIWSSCADIDEKNQQTVPIGRPLPNQQLYILDPQQQRLPIGAIGEIYIAGDGVVRGYHNRQDLTAKAFLPDPFASKQGARMYRTGDLGRILPDGQLECLGRVDHQIKIRGYRVELGEIESVLRQQPEIQESVVILREDVPGDKRLIAYVTQIAGKEINKDRVKNALNGQLPEFMVPSSFVVLEQLPETPNGKIDRSRLPKPKLAQEPIKIVASVDNSTQKLLVDVWTRALQSTEFGIRDNFFDIGGHSLLIIQVLDDLAGKINTPVKLTDLFKYTTIESLASFLDQESAATEQLSQGQARVAARKASMNRRRRKSTTA